MMNQQSLQHPVQGLWLQTHPFSPRLCLQAIGQLRWLHNKVQKVVGGDELPRDGGGWEGQDQQLRQREQLLMQRMLELDPGKMFQLKPIMCSN